MSKMVETSSSPIVKLRSLEDKYYIHGIFVNTWVLVNVKIGESLVKLAHYHMAIVRAVSFRDTKDAIVDQIRTSREFRESTKE